MEFHLGLEGSENFISVLDDWFSDFCCCQIEFGFMRICDLCKLRTSCLYFWCESKIETESHVIVTCLYIRNLALNFILETESHVWGKDEAEEKFEIDVRALRKDKRKFIVVSERHELVRVAMKIN